MKKSKNFKVKLQRDLIPSITNNGELVGIYYKDKYDKNIEKLIIETSPKKADKLLKLWKTL